MDMEINRDWVHKIACGALKDTIRAHGPITQEWTGSAAKRVAGRIMGELEAQQKGTKREKGKRKKT